VTQRTAATRYARALIDVALKEQVDLTRVEAELAGFAGLLSTHEALGKALLNPAVPTPRKRAAVEALLAGQTVLPVVSKLLLLLADRDRFPLLSDLLEAFRLRLLDYQKVVRAEVTTASALGPDQARAFEQTLGRATGRTIRLTTRVDPAIVGGVIARVGSTVYDGSITNHLKRIKQRLEERL
jgi:F-type H+-transporting ATPase subunit delta